MNIKELAKKYKLSTPIIEGILADAAPLVAVSDNEYVKRMEFALSAIRKAAAGGHIFTNRLQFIYERADWSEQWKSDYGYKIRNTALRENEELKKRIVELEAGQVAPQATVELLTDEQLLVAFSSAESVIDGLHEVRALFAATPPTSKATEQGGLQNSFNLSQSHGQHQIGAACNPCNSSNGSFDLMPVITWLENGCDPKEAVKELRIYQSKMGAMAASKADTGEVRNAALNRAYDEGVRFGKAAALEEAAHSWGIACGFDKHGVSAFILALKSATPSTIKAEPTYCPHAAPHRYCDGCVVTPCPIGLGDKND